MLMSHMCVHLFQLVLYEQKLLISTAIAKIAKISE